MGTNIAVDLLTKRKTELESTSTGRELAQINEALVRLAGEDVILVAGANTRLPSAADYTDLGIVVAAKKWLKEVGGDKTTREIVEGLQARGWTTKSDNAVATVYSTLTNSKDFKRSGAGREGRWSLKESRR